MARRTATQLNAISKAYARQRLAEVEKEADSLGLSESFLYQKSFCTLRGFLQAVKEKTAKGKKALTEAKTEAERLLTAYPPECWKRETAEKVKKVCTELLKGF